MRKRPCPRFQHIGQLLDQEAVIRTVMEALVKEHGIVSLPQLVDFEERPPASVNFE